MNILGRPQNIVLRARNISLLKHRHCTNLRTMKTDGNVLIPTKLDNLLSTSWIRHHLYTLGYDIVKLQLYQKFSHLLTAGGGGIIKTVVFDLSAFIKRELKPNDMQSTTAQQLRDLVYFGSNSNYYLANTTNEEQKIYNRQSISDFRWFFIAVGYMIVSQSDNNIDDITDKIINIYINSNNNRILEDATRRENDINLKVLELAKEYYQSVPINHEKLYGNEPKYITMFETKNYRINLPPLPKIHNRELLAKSLMHKELYRGLLDPKHQFSKELKQRNINLDKGAYNIIKYDLSFLDGLGDFYLARESSNLLYKYRGLPNDNPGQFGRKSYNLLRTILATNTLLSELALAYNLHQGLDDVIVFKLLRKSYVPNLNQWKNSNPNFDNDDARRYEQEFIADYFEQYVGALFLESPDIAQKWIAEIYENVLLLISDVHRPTGQLKNYNYSAWSADVIGRSLFK